MDDIWSSILSEIELEVSKPTFLTFFKKTRLVSLENSIATVFAPTYMIAEQIEKRYSSLIKTLLDKKTNKNISVVFTSSRLAQPKTEALTEGPLFVKTAVKSKKRPSRVKEEHGFENLAVSDSNQLAYTAALTVSQNLGEKFNPLFIYGSVGVGKTHIMHSIANKVYEDNPEASIIYLTTEEFTNEVVEAIRDKNTQNLRRKFRNTNLLLLDDIQFLTGKEKVQEELFHTFNTLIDNGGQIVFSSDRPPSELKKIEARLASRFEGGLTVDIGPPDFELRTAILLLKSVKYEIKVSTEIAKTIAERVEDTRALEGFLLRLSAALMGKKGGEATQELVLKLLGSPKEKGLILHPDSVVDAVCSFFNLKPTQLKGEKRDSFLVRPRHICMYLLKEEARLPLVEIGNLLGGRDHTTVMHGLKKVGSLLKTDLRTREEMAYLKGRIING
jgi:chromosomal replication initiator protein